MNVAFSHSIRAALNFLLEEFHAKDGITTFKHKLKEYHFHAACKFLFSNMPLASSVHLTGNLTQMSQ